MARKCFSSVRYGDPPGFASFVGGRGMLVIPMSTAIVRMYVTDGFIVAADGRKYDPENHLILSDTAQKIFSIDSPGKSLAYSLTGVIGLGPNDSEDLGFNFEKEIAQAVTTARTSTEKTLDAYARVLARYTHKALRVAQKSGRVGWLPESPRDREQGPGVTLATVLIDGYYRNEPSRATIRFFHENQDIPTPQIGLQDLVLGRCIGYVSPTIVSLVDRSDDSRFTKYRKAARADMTLSEAAEVAKAYIDAHCDPAAADIDPDHHAAVGGHIHVASVTRGAGFQWITPPI